MALRSASNSGNCILSIGLLFCIRTYRLQFANSVKCKFYSLQVAKRADKFICIFGSISYATEWTRTEKNFASGCAGLLQSCPTTMPRQQGLRGAHRWPHQRSRAL